MHAISSYRGTKGPTNKQTHPQTHTNHRQDRLQYTAPQLASALCKKTHNGKNLTSLADVMKRKTEK